MPSAALAAAEVKSWRQAECTAELRRQVAALSNELETKARGAQMLGHATLLKLGAGRGVGDTEPSFLMRKGSDVAIAILAYSATLQYIIPVCC